MRLFSLHVEKRRGGCCGMGAGQGWLVLLVGLFGIPCVRKCEDPILEEEQLEPQRATCALELFRLLPPFVFFL